LTIEQNKIIVDVLAYYKWNTNDIVRIQGAKPPERYAHLLMPHTEAEIDLWFKSLGWDLYKKRYFSGRLYGILKDEGLKKAKELIHNNQGKLFEIFGEKYKEYGSIEIDDSDLILEAPEDEENE